MQEPKNASEAVENGKEEARATEKNRGKHTVKKDPRKFGRHRKVPNHNYRR